MAFTDLVHKWLGHGKYNATLPTLTDGAEGELQVDSRGRQIVVIGGDTGVATETSTATTWVHEITGTHKNTITGTANKHLLYFYVQSSYAVAGFIQFHNLAAHASLSTGVSVPKIASIALPANGLVSVAFPRGPKFATGIVWAFSTTANVWTQDAAATIRGSFEII